MRIYTSNFARISKFEKELVPVGIAIGPPSWYRGRSMTELAPRRDMLKMSTATYIEHFKAILNKLDVQEVLAKLGDNAVMMCWESPGVFCHRRMVAEWIEIKAGISVPELGFARDGFPTHLEMPEKGSDGERAIKKRLESLKLV